MRSPFKPASFAIVACCVMLALSGCSTASDSSVSETPAVTAPAEPDTSTAPDTNAAPDTSTEPGQPGTSTESDARTSHVPSFASSAPLGVRPAWASNPVNVGTLVTEEDGDFWNAKVFRVGTVLTKSAGVWNFPGTSDPVMPAGTSMTVYTSVFTNTSSEGLVLDGPAALTLMHQGVTPYLASLMTFERTATEPFGLDFDPFDSDPIDAASEASAREFGGRLGFIVAPGESFAVTTNTWALPGVVHASAYVNVMDEDGERRADASEVFSLSVTQ